jgi:hypothetical protein
MWNKFGILIFNRRLWQVNPHLSQLIWNQSNFDEEFYFDKAWYWLSSNFKVRSTNRDRDGDFIISFFLSSNLILLIHHLRWISVKKLSSSSPAIYIKCNIVIQWPMLNGILYLINFRKMSTSALEAQIKKLNIIKWTWNLCNLFFKTINIKILFSIKKLSLSFF